MNNNNDFYRRSLLIVLIFFIVSCSEQNNKSNKEIATDDLNKKTIPNCVLDVEAKQIKKCTPEPDEAHVGFGGLLMINAIHPDRQWVPTIGFELHSKNEFELLRITFSIEQWARDEQGNALVSQTPFIGHVEKWKDKELAWRKPVGVQILPAKPFAFALDWQQHNVNITLNDEKINIENLDFDITKFSMFGSGVRVATSELGVLSL